MLAQVKTTRVLLTLLCMFMWALGALGAVGVTDARADEIRIGVHANIGFEQSKARWQATADYLQAQIPQHTFKLLHYESLANFSLDAKMHRFEFVITNPSSYIDMEINAGASRILTLINKRQGKPYSQFGSVIFTRADNPSIQFLRDIKNKSVMAVDERSFGGWQMAWGELLSHGISPKSDLKSLSFAGGVQQNVVFGVRDGEADVGVVRTDMLERMAENGTIELKNFRVIRAKDDLQTSTHNNRAEGVNFPFLRSTDLYPEWAFAKLANTDPALSDAIALALLSLPAASPAAQTGKYMGWTVPLSYQPVHNLLKSLKVGPYKDYGKVTLADTWQTFSAWIVVIGLSILLIIIISIFAITRSKKLANRTRELEFRKQSMNEHAIISIAGVDGNITYANDKFCTISGYDREELIGQNHRILKSDEHSPEFYADMWDTISSGEVWHGTIKNNHKDEGFYWVEATIVPFLNKKGKPFQYISIRTDITQRIEAQQRETNANQAKTHFLSSMSHELRTPMNAVLGFAQILQYDTKDPLTDNQQASLGHILESGRLLLALIDQILDLAKIESGKIDIALEDVALRPILDTYIQTLQAASDAALPVEFIFDETFDETLAVLADKARISQVLENLVDNAIKYNCKNGTIILACRPTSSGMVHLSITDTGCGIADDKLDDLFIPFNRPRSSDHMIGTGIGLSISKTLIATMGGNIGVHSEVNKGSTFWIELPISHNKNPGKAALSVRQNQTKPATSQDTEASMKGTLLYIEDNPANLRLMEMIVKPISGLEITTATTAEGGIKQASHSPPDMIILDISLPGMDGYEALNILNGLESTKNIPVIALSGNAMSRDIQKGLDAGFVHYLTKPIKVVEVLAVIKSTLNK